MGVKFNKIGLINWHYINNWQTGDIGNLTFITGGNIAGKTTLVDAIQTCLYVCPDSYNLANSVEARNKTRTLMGYVRAKTDSGQYIRNGLVHTHIVCELEDNGETYLVGFFCKVAANVYEKDGIKRIWWSGKGHLSDIDVMTEDEYGMPIVKDLNELLADVRDAKTFTSQKEAKLFFGRRFGFSASAKGDLNIFNQILKLHKQTVAFNPKEAGNVNQMLKKYIFHEEPIDISDYKESLNRQNVLQAELIDIQKEADILKKIDAANYNMIEAENNETIRSVSMSLIEKDIARTKLAKSTEEKEEAEKELSRLLAEKELVRKRYDSLLIGKENLKHESGIDQIEEKISEQELRVRECENAKRVVDAFRKEADAFTSAHMAGKPCTIDALTTFMSEQKAEIDTLRNGIQKTIESRNELEEEKRRLETKSGYADRKYMDAMNMLRTHFRGLGLPQPEFLYKKLECDSEWQEVVERYMGNRRFDIVVNPDDYRTAAAFIRDNCRGMQVTLINLENMPEIKAEDGSVAAVLTSDNEFVKSYINYRYNRVLFSEDVAHEKYKDGYTYVDKNFLRYSARSLTTMFSVHLVIGEEARLNRIEEIGRELSELREKRGALEGNLNAATAALTKAKTLIGMFPMDGVVALAETLESEQTELKNLVATRDVMTTSDYKKKIDFYDSELANARTRQKEIESAVSVSDRNIAIAEADIATESQKLSDAEEALRGVPTADAEAYISSLPSVSLYRLRNEMNTFHDEATREREKRDRDMEDYGRRYGRNADITYCLGRLEEVSTGKIPKIISDLEDIKKETRSGMTEKVIAQLKANMRRAENFIHDINRTLEKLPFNGGHYEIKPITAEEGFEDVYYAIRHYTPANTTLSLFDEAPEADGSEELVDYLVEKLLEQTDNKTSVDYLDYTTYCRFGLYHCEDTEGRKTDMQDKIAEGSGAEVQIPIYLIFAIAIVNKTGSSRYAMKESDALRLMCVDEAFEKLDDSNKQKLMSLLVRDMGIQLVTLAPINMYEDFSGADSFLILQVYNGNRYIRNYSCYRDFDKDISDGMYEKEVESTEQEA